MGFNESNLNRKKPTESQSYESYEFVVSQKDLVSKINDELQKANDVDGKLKVYERFLSKGTDLAVKLDLVELKTKIGEETEIEKKALLGEIEAKFLLYSQNQLKDRLFIDNVLNVSSDKFMLQDKKRVIDNIQRLGKRKQKEYLDISSDEVAKLSINEKIEILSCLENQSDESSVYILKNYYVQKLQEKDLNPLIKVEADKFIYQILSQLKSVQDVSNRLNSLLEGGAQYTSERWIDTKGNFDLDGSDLSTLNHEAWGKTKEHFGTLVEKFKDAPLPVKGLALLGSILGYKLISGMKSTGENSFAYKALKYALIGFGGYIGVNLLTDQYEKYGNNDYVKTNKFIKGYDYAKFFVGEKYTDEDVKASEALISNMYNPKVNNIEFAEVIENYKSNTPDSTNWIKMFDGKDTDMTASHNSIKLLVDRYDPTSKSTNSIYKAKDVPESAKKEIEQIWKQSVIERKSRKSELSFKDVVLRILSVDPKFTFENQRHLGNDLKVKIQEYKDYQDKVRKLQRLFVLDDGLSYIDENSKDYEHLALMKIVRGITDQSLVYGIQGSISDKFVNIDSIATKAEFDRYKEASKQHNFHFMPKKVSFMGEDLTLSTGERVLISTEIGGNDPKIKDKHLDLLENDVKLIEVNKETPKDQSTVEKIGNTVSSKIDKYAKSSLVYNPSVAAKDQKTFMEDFKVVSQLTGKEIDLSKRNPDLFDVKTLSNNHGPVMIRFKDNVALEPRRNIKLKDYVFYGKEINFM